MTNIQKVILEGLISQTKLHYGFEKINCLNLHYQENIELYEELINAGLKTSAKDIVDIEMKLIKVIYFKEDENVSIEKIKEILSKNTEDEKALYIVDTDTGEKYLYSFNIDLEGLYKKADLITK